MAVFFLVGICTPTAAAASTITGTATKCSGLAVCSYSLAGGTGSASVAGGAPAYVGENFTFYGGSVSFILPGETSASSQGGVYSGQETNTKVFSSTVGLIYHITGSFAAADNNSGTIVKGTTNGYVGIKGHSGRGGGIYFTLINGSITLRTTSIYATKLSVTCNPTSFRVGKTTVCTATVTDWLSSALSVPSGKVTLYSTLGFSPIKCTLSVGTCSVTIKPAAGTWPVYASYGGDKSHYLSSARGPELYVSCPAGGC